MFFRSFFFAFVIATPSFADVGACPISADFITDPQTVENKQQIGDLQVVSITKRSFVEGAMVQIECTDIAPDQVFPGMTDALVLANYARYWSVEPTGPAVAVDTPAEHYLLEGVKDIDGTRVTYTYRLYRFDASYAMVATAVPGGGTPPDVQTFLSSLVLSSIAPQPFTQAEKAEGLRSHIAACLPAVQADNEGRQLGLSEVEITYFCSCTGNRYFTEFTRAELRTLAMGSDAEIEQRRLSIQTECFEEALH